MTDPQLTLQLLPQLTVQLQLLPVPAAVVLIVTAGIAYYLGRRLEQWPAVLNAGLAAPASLILIGILHAATTPPDDFPRGWILIAYLVASAATLPVTLIVSYFAVSYARR